MNNTLDNLCMGCFAQLGAPNTRCHVCGYVPQCDNEGQHRLNPRTVLSGKYVVGKALGEGGFGITYLGYDLNLDIKVAIKEFYPFGFVTRSSTMSTTVQPLAGEQGEFFLRGRERFVDEAKRLAKFRTFPGIVMVNDFFVENGTAYIVMEYVEGETLKSYMAQQGGRLPADMMLAMMKPVFQSLSQIHDEGLIHRDISPDNIMITYDGSVKLLDFGAAREFGEDGNKSLSVMLKHGYAPPEQYTSRGVQGPHTDVYALCATIYKAVTGETPESSMDRVMDDYLQPPSALGVVLPYHVEAALMRGLAVKVTDRWQTVGELYTALYNAEFRIQNAEMGYNQGVQQPVYSAQPVEQPPALRATPFQGRGQDAPYAQQPAYDGRQVATPTGADVYQQVAPQTSYTSQPAYDGRLIIAPTDANVTPAPKVKKPMTAGKRGGIIAAAVGAVVIIALVVALTTRQGTSGEDKPFSWDMLDPYDVRSLWEDSPSIDNFNKVMDLSYNETESEYFEYESYVYTSPFANTLPHMESADCYAETTPDGYVEFFSYDHYPKSDATPQDIIDTYFALVNAVSDTLGEPVEYWYYLYEDDLDLEEGSEKFDADKILAAFTDEKDTFYFVSYFGDIGANDYQSVVLYGSKEIDELILYLSWDFPLEEKMMQTDIDPPSSVEEDAISEPSLIETLAPVYKAYYDVIMTAIDEYGIGADVDPNQDYAALVDEWHAKSTSGVYTGQGLYRAELIYFGDSEIPQLLYIYDSGYGPGRYVGSPIVYGYSGTVECYTDGNEYSLFIGGDDPYGELYLVEDVNGMLYLLSAIRFYDFDEDGYTNTEQINTYYTVKNNQWVIIPENEIDIVSSRDLNEYSPDSVYAMLDELQSMLPSN